ncbi:hypothetical protein [Brevibacillus choshinensis]|nr:hypothetical protein [Brevibacillus choshinensis]
MAKGSKQWGHGRWTGRFDMVLLGAAIFGLFLLFKKRPEPSI